MPHCFSEIMDEHQSKRCKTPDGKLLAEKVQNLPLLCVDAICKFTTSSNLARLYSDAVPLPGAFWNACLEAALRKRFPLSIRDDPSNRQANALPDVIFDAAGAKVTSIKQPGAFRFSPLRDLIGHAFLSLRFNSATKKAKPQMYVAHGEDILSHLPSVTELTLVVQSVRGSKRGVTMEKNKLESNLKHLLPRLQSLAVRDDDRSCHHQDTRLLDTALADYLWQVALPEMASLRCLGLTEGVFFGILAQQVVSIPGSAAERVLSQLSSLNLSPQWWWLNRHPPNAGHDMMRFVASHCRQLSTLSVVVHGEFKAYVAAFRALANLKSLGLNILEDPDLNGISFNESEAIGSVLDLRVDVEDSYNLRQEVFSVASLFPNAKSLAFEHHDYEDYQALELAAECCMKRLLPAIEKLSCFCAPTALSFCSSKRLTDFIGSSNLPEAIDLSPMMFLQLLADSNLLADIYRAMQFNSTKSLLMRGAINREALSVLQSRVDLSGEKIRLTAWIDRDLGEQPPNSFREPIAQQTDFKIVGVKTGGSLKGQKFTIRVMHQLTKSPGIFDFVEEES